MILNSLVCLLALVTSPQQEDVKSGLAHSKAGTTTATGFVTQAEAKAVFARAEAMLRRVTKSSAKVAPIGLKDASSLVSRKAVITEFGRLYMIAKPAFKLIPAPVPVNTQVLKASDAPTRELLTLLVKRGAVANYGPVAAGPADRLTVKQFGDAVGFFLARMAEMSHMPSTKYSPALMGG
jgi:hypothetical protein